MTAASLPVPPAAAGQRPPPWRDVRVVRAVLQVAFLIALGSLLWWLYRNLVANMSAQGIRTTFDYLRQPAGFQIRGSPFRSSQSVQDAIYVGARNTAAIAVAGVALTTVLGVLAGVARLSQNWLVRKAAALYVETLRNVPPLLVILFAYLALFIKLPRIQDAVEIPGLLVISNRELAVAAPVAGDNAGVFALVLAVAGLVAAAVWVVRTRAQLRTGHPHHRVAFAIAVVTVIAIPAYVLLDGPVGLSRPAAGRFRVSGGAEMTVNYAAALVALVVYTASHIAEIVRGSILAVPKGQTEAATALALTDFQRLRFVVLPQALRVAIPPTINQFLNLTKNTSLAVAIAYPELMRITLITIGNGHPAPQSFVVVMGTYLAFSLAISLLVNVLNRRLRLVER
jgi:general L-amino acid transport system permease protein